MAHDDGLNLFDDPDDFEGENDVEPDASDTPRRGFPAGDAEPTAGRRGYDPDEEDATVEIPVRLAPEREDRSEHAGATRVDGDAARTRLPHGSSEEPAASSDDSAGAVADESSGGNARSR